MVADMQDNNIDIQLERFPQWIKNIFIILVRPSRI